jgi:hypothetical protein
MNVSDVSKREILDYKQFLSKVHDFSYKPLDPQNQTDSSDRTGLHKIQRQPQYDYVGYANAAFNNTSTIDLPGYNDNGGREYINGIGGDSTNTGSVFNMDTSESVKESIIPFDKF